jgi:oligoribonuclease
MAQDQNHLIWLDMEMTGLNPDSDRIIEMAMVVTNSKLDVIAEGR